MHPGFLRRATALGLTTLLAVLATGLPSHHHDDPDGTEWSVVGTHHHDHGVVIVEQPERVQAKPILLGLPEHEVAVLVSDATRIRMPEAQTARPTERAPPSLHPRGPPSVL